MSAIVDGNPKGGNVVPSRSDDSAARRDRPASVGDISEAVERVRATIHQINGHWWNRRARPAAPDLRTLLDTATKATALQARVDDAEQMLRNLLEYLEGVRSCRLTHTAVLNLTEDWSSEIRATLARKDS